MARPILHSIQTAATVGGNLLSHANYDNEAQSEAKRRRRRKQRPGQGHWPGLPPEATCVMHAQPDADKKQRGGRGTARTKQQQVGRCIV